MACPNACGCFALLISGLKQKHISRNPYRLALAAKITAKSIGDVFNNGLIQVQSSWDHLVAFDSQNLDVLYKVS
jgi:tripeptidyl-peptidase II